MNIQLFNLAEDSDTPTAYVGAHIPLRLYRLLAEEAERARVSRSQVLRWALDERYGKQQEEPEEEA